MKIRGHKIAVKCAALTTILTAHFTQTVMEIDSVQFRVMAARAPITPHADIHHRNTRIVAPIQTAHRHFASPS